MRLTSNSIFSVSFTVKMGELLYYILWYNGTHFGDPWGSDVLYWRLTLNGPLEHPAGTSGEAFQRRM